jgi:hypothetical protein
LDLLCALWVGVGGGVRGGNGIGIMKQAASRIVHIHYCSNLQCATWTVHV